VTPDGDKANPDSVADSIGSIRSILRSITSGSITASIELSSARIARASSARSATAAIAATNRQLKSCLTLPR
jgi:hypothetical protein